jgi:hypothetical protein
VHLQFCARAFSYLSQIAHFGCLWIKEAYCASRPRIARAGAPAPIASTTIAKAQPPASARARIVSIWRRPEG